MQPASSITTIDQLIKEISNALEVERKALLRMDAEGIEVAAAQKSALCDELSQKGQQITAAHRSALAAIQADIRHNLILLVHARDHVQGALGILTGRPSLPGHMHQRQPASVRLDLRG